MAAYYNSDIAHCSGVDCPLCNKCDRFRLYVVHEKANIIEISPFVIPEYNPDTNDCRLFKPLNK